MSKDDKILAERLIEESNWHDPTCNELLKEAAVRIEDMTSAQLPEHSAWFRIGETLVDESKGHITPEQAIRKIREYLRMMEKPERKKGKWIDMGDFEQCSVCGCTHLKEFQSYYGKTLWVKSKFCPGCGAELMGEENED